MTQQPQPTQEREHFGNTCLGACIGFSLLVAAYGFLLWVVSK